MVIIEQLLSVTERIVQLLVLQAALYLSAVCSENICRVAAYI